MNSEWKNEIERLSTRRSVTFFCRNCGAINVASVPKEGRIARHKCDNCDFFQRPPRRTRLGKMMPPPERKEHNTNPYPPILPSGPDWKVTAAVTTVAFFAVLFLVSPHGRDSFGLRLIKEFALSFVEPQGK